MKTFVILGSGGVIGRNVAGNLRGNESRIKLFSRAPVRVNPDDELIRGDLTEKGSVAEAVKDADVAFLTAGLKYDTRTWKTQWPVVMNNAIDACSKAGCRLVFFDNCYLYGKVNGKMTEETPVNPSSVKGQVRAEIAGTLTDKIRQGSITALIARSADFYGPETPLSFVSAVVFDRLAKGRKPMWIANDKVRHSMTFTPDAGKATALLGLTERAYNQVWHLPTHPDALTGEQIIKIAAGHFGKGPDHAVVSRNVQKFIGLFNRALRENNEMLYQNEYEYLFDSSRFENEFGIKATTYDEGIKMTVAYYMSQAPGASA